MSAKEFDKKQLMIEALNSQELNMMNDDMDTEDEIMPQNPRQLLKRFEDWWQKDGADKVAEGVAN